MSAPTPVTLPDGDGDAPLVAAVPSAGNDRYTLEREIGSGGMGRVFAAREPSVHAG